MHRRRSSSAPRHASMPAVPRCGRCSATVHRSHRARGQPLPAPTPLFFPMPPLSSCSSRPRAVPLRLLSSALQRRCFTSSCRLPVSSPLASATARPRTSPYACMPTIALSSATVYICSRDDRSTTPPPFVCTCVPNGHAEPSPFRAPQHALCPAGEPPLSASALPPMHPSRVAALDCSAFWSSLAQAPRTMLPCRTTIVGVGPPAAWSQRNAPAVCTTGPSATHVSPGRRPSGRNWPEPPSSALALLGKKTRGPRGKNIIFLGF